MLTVVCVLRSGGSYDARYVARLLAGVRRNLGIPFRFMCLTDMMADCLDAIPELENIPDGAYQDQTGTFATKLEHDWPGWWAKMELFRLPGPLLYFDLDTVIVGDITPLANATLALKPNELLGMRSFYGEKWQSGIMGWSDLMTALYESFRTVVPDMTWRDQAGRIRAHRGDRRFKGDADWIVGVSERNHLSLVHAEAALPGIYGYRAEVQKGHAANLPDDARVVCFYCHPRPGELLPAPAWLLEHWGEAE